MLPGEPWGFSRDATDIQRMPWDARMLPWYSSRVPGPSALKGVAPAQPLGQRIKQSPLKILFPKLQYGFLKVLSPFYPRESLI